MNRSLIPYVVERMTLADVPVVAALEQAIFPLPWSAYAFEHELQHNPAAYFAVVRPRMPGTLEFETKKRPGTRATGTARDSVSRGILGYGGFWFIVDEAHICTLAVHPNWRARGLGELLLTALIERAGEINAAVLTLEVRASNVAAQGMYRKYGFIWMGLRKRYYSDNNEDAIIMTTDPISSAAFQRRFQTLRTVLYQKLTAGSVGT